jgi:hypothetical protein
MAKISGVLGVQLEVLDVELLFCCFVPDST